MMSALEKLASIGEPTIRTAAPSRVELAAAFGGDVAREVMRLLEHKNGFYAFDRALHVFSDLGAPAEPGLIAWNSPESWRRDYEGLADHLVCFAEDIFGSQFCFAGHGIHIFEPETGETVKIAGDLEEWASRVLSARDMLTGSSLAHLWRAKHGEIPPNIRLMPKTPFVSGGRYEISNLHPVDAARSMKLRAKIAQLLR